MSRPNTNTVTEWFPKDVALCVERWDESKNK